MCIQVLINRRTHLWEISEGLPRDGLVRANPERIKIIQPKVVTKSLPWVHFKNGINPERVLSELFEMIQPRWGEWRLDKT